MDELRVAHDVLLQNAATTGNGTAVDLGGLARNISVYIRWSSGVSGGQVIIETASDTAFTGTWASLSGAVNSTANKEDIVQISGTLAAVRARISTDVVGGTVTVKLMAN